MSVVEWNGKSEDFNPVYKTYFKSILGDDHLRTLTKLGFDQAVYDYDHNHTRTLDIKELGQVYIDGYNLGQKEAAKRKWYIISVGGGKKLYYLSLEVGNSWTNTKENSTTFPNQEAASEILRGFGSARGVYTIVWE